MNEDRWPQIKSLFDRALERDQTTRLSFVKSECGGDEELCREVEILLKAYDTSGSRPQHPSLLARSPSLDAQTNPLTETMSSGSIVIGRYQIQQELGRGGMSVVYLAQDLQLLSRRDAD